RHQIGTSRARRQQFIGADRAEVDAARSHHLQDRHSRAAPLDLDADAVSLVSAVLTPRVEATELRLGHPIERKLDLRWCWSTRIGRSRLGFFSAACDQAHGEPNQKRGKAAAREHAPFYHLCLGKLNQVRANAAKAAYSGR